MSDITNNRDKVYRGTVTIADGETTSDALDCYGTRLVAVQFPSAFTGATATFRVSPDGETYYSLYDTEGNEVTITATDGAMVPVDFRSFLAPRYIAIVSASAEAEERSVVLYTRPF